MYLAFHPGIWTLGVYPKKQRTHDKEYLHEPSHGKVGCNRKHLERAQVFFSMELVKLAMVHEHEQLQTIDYL